MQYSKKKGRKIGIRIGKANIIPYLQKLNCLYVENLRSPTHKILELKRKFQKFVGYKVYTLKKNQSFL